MKRLLDINTWIALTVETHPHHASARKWYEDAALTRGDLVLCLPTELGFLRLLTPNIWLDAYLAAFAIGLGCEMVTFDRGFEFYQTSCLVLHLLESP